MTDYVTVDVPRGTEPAPALFAPKDKITIFRHDDVDTFPTRDDKGIYIAGNVIMASNKNMLILYVTAGTTTFEGVGEGDADAKGILQSITAAHPGYALLIAEFLRNNLNYNLGAVIEFCDGSTPFLFGSECAPLQLVPNVNAADGKIQSEFTAASLLQGPPIAHYGGTLTLAANFTIAIDDVTPSVAEGTGRYDVSDSNTGATPITSLDDAVKGMIITLVGNGGANPSTITAAATEFLLVGDVTWTSIDGSTITFEVFDTDIFIERSRT